MDKAIYKPKAFRRKKLNELEKKVLHKISRFGYQRFQELSAEVLSSVSRRHAWRVMRGLSDRNFVHVDRLSEGQILGWTLSKPYRKYLRRNAKDPSSICSQVTYAGKYDHDATVRRVEQLIKSSPVVSDWVPEPRLRQRVAQDFHFRNRESHAELIQMVPDGLFTITAKGKPHKVALEVELTRKSLDRIRRKLEAQILSDEYDFVFYVMGSEALKALFWREYLQILDTSHEVALHDAPNGIYFTTLDEVNKLGLKAPLQGTKSTTSIHDIG